MTYLSGKTQKRKQNIRYLLLLGFIVILVIFWVTFKSVLYPVFEPIAINYSGAKGGIASIPQFFSTYIISRSSLVQKNKALEISIENLENELAEKNALLQESSSVILEDGNSPNSATLVMYPLMEDITKIYSTILLSKGYKDGVEKDTYVYVRGLQPVCIIKEVYTSTSLCELISKGGITTEAVIKSSESSTTIMLTLTGRGGGAFLGDVARDTPIATGDKVFLRSDQSMTVGTVVDVIHNNQDTSWHVFVRGLYNPLTSSIFYMHKK